MGRVMVRCPQTGRAISTGIETDAARFNSMPVFFGHTWCPHCRTIHHWFAREAWIGEPRLASSGAVPIRRVHRVGKESSI